MKKLAMMFTLVAIIISQHADNQPGETVPLYPGHLLIQIIYMKYMTNTNKFYF